MTLRRLVCGMGIVSILAIASAAQAVKPLPPEEREGLEQPLAHKDAQEYRINGYHVARFDDRRSVLIPLQRGTRVTMKTLVEREDMRRILWDGNLPYLGKPIKWYSENGIEVAVFKGDMLGMLPSKRSSALTIEQLVERERLAIRIWNHNILANGDDLPQWVKDLNCESKGYVRDYRLTPAQTIFGNQCFRAGYVEKNECTNGTMVGEGGMLVVCETDQQIRERHAAKANAKGMRSYME